MDITLVTKCWQFFLLVCIWFAPHKTRRTTLEDIHFQQHLDQPQQHLMQHLEQFQQHQEHHQ
jgi:hypothetical protein